MVSIEDLCTLIAYSNSKYPLLFSSEELAWDLCPKIIIVIVAGMHELKSSFCAIKLLSHCFSILKQLLVSTVHLSVARGGYFFSDYHSKLLCLLLTCTCTCTVAVKKGNPDKSSNYVHVYDCVVLNNKNDKNNYYYY